MLGGTEALLGLFSSLVPALWPLALVASMPTPDDCTPWQFIPRAQYEAAACDLSISLHFHLAGAASDLSASVVEAQVGALNQDFESAEAGIHFAYDPISGLTRYQECRSIGDADGVPTGRGAAPALQILVDAFEEFQGELEESEAARPSPERPMRWISLDVGSIGPRGVSARPGNLGRTLTHEVGHALGLLHPFEGGCLPSTPPECYSSGDTLCDTFPMPGPSAGGSCRPVFGCGRTAVPDNFMDWSDDRCRLMFTHEQVQRMRCTLSLWAG